MAEYQCSQCHHVWQAEAPPPVCPNCHAEAGMERHGAVPLAMRLFSGWLLLAILVAVSGSVFARLYG